MKEVEWAGVKGRRVSTNETVAGAGAEMVPHEHASYADRRVPLVVNCSTSRSNCVYHLGNMI